MDITVTLHRKDLEKAISQYLASHGQSTDNKTMTVDFKAGRGVANVSATVVLKTQDSDFGTSSETETVEDEEEESERKSFAKPEQAKDASMFSVEDKEEKKPAKNNPLFS